MAPAPKNVEGEIVDKGIYPTFTFPSHCAAILHASEKPVSSCHVVLWIFVACVAFVLLAWATFEFGKVYDQYLA